mgnify:FL=1
MQIMWMEDTQPNYFASHTFYPHVFSSMVYCLIPFNIISCTQFEFGPYGLQNRFSKLVTLESQRKTMLLGVIP